MEWRAVKISYHSMAEIDARGVVVSHSSQIFDGTKNASLLPQKSVELNQQQKKVQF